MTDRTHLYAGHSVAHSVLTQTPTESACGITSTLTRERVDAASGLPVCADCTAFAASLRTRETSATIRPTTGWTDMLEGDLLDRYRDDEALPARMAEHERAVAAKAFRDYADWLEALHGDKPRKSIKRMLRMLRSHAASVEAGGRR